jgi:hypothetical protein
MLKVMGLTFFLVGGGLLTGAYFSVRSTQTFLASAQKTEGTVIDLEESVSKTTKNGRTETSRTYVPVIKFQGPNGADVVFRSNTGSNPPSHAIDDKVEVLYSPSNPANAKLNGIFEIWGTGLILGLIGLVFASVGGASLALAIRNARVKAWLLKNGSTINAPIKEVRLNESLKVNGRSPWIIVCEWQDPKSKNIYSFKSENFWYDPSEYISAPQMLVKIDPSNPKKYWVDISQMPKKAA